jgi:hypothetical protein
MREELKFPQVDTSNYFRASQLLEYIYDHPNHCKKELEEFNSYRNGCVEGEISFGKIDIKYFVEENDFDYFATAKEMLKPFPPKVHNLTTGEITFILNKVYDYLDEEDLDKVNYYITLLDISLNLTYSLDLEDCIYSRKYTVPQLVKLLKEHNNSEYAIID